jgi:hypothetical protein
LLQIVHEPERIDRLRTVLSGFCHRCRNSLNGIKMSLYLFRREACGAVPDSWRDIEAIYQQVEHLFDHLQSIYRPMTVTMMRSPLDELIRHHAPKWSTWCERRDLTLCLEPPDSEVIGDFDPAQLGAGLDALAAWRADVGPRGGLARVAWNIHDSSIEIRWREMAPQDTRELRDEPCLFGRRDSSPSPRCVDVLALPVLGRILAAHGGRLHSEQGAGFGVRLRWPRYRRVNHGGLA